MNWKNQAIKIMKKVFIFNKTKKNENSSVIKLEILFKIALIQKFKNLKIYLKMKIKNFFNNQIHNKTQFWNLIIY